MRTRNSIVQRVLITSRKAGAREAALKALEPLEAVLRGQKRWELVPRAQLEHDRVARMLRILFEGHEEKPTHVSITGFGQVSGRPAADVWHSWMEKMADEAQHPAELVEEVDGLGFQYDQEFLDLTLSVGSESLMNLDERMQGVASCILWEVVGGLYAAARIGRVEAIQEAGFLLETILTHALVAQGREDILILHAPQGVA